MRPTPLGRLCAPAIALAALASLTGCTTGALRPPSQPDARPAPVAQVEAPPTRPFAADTLYALLVAELAGKARQYDFALATYLDQARRTQDPAVTERALQVARFLGDHDAMLQSAQWLIELRPNDPHAWRVVALEWARLGRFEPAVEAMARLERQGAPTDFDYLALQAARSDGADLEPLLARLRALSLEFPQQADLRIGEALLLRGLGRSDEALKAVRKAERLTPSAKVTVLQAELLNSQGHADAALALMREAVDAHPEDARLRAQYIHLLAGAGEQEAVAAEIERFAAGPVANPELAANVAQLALRLGLLDAAERLLVHQLRVGYQVDEGYLRLAGVALARRQPEQALTYLRAIDGGPLYLTALGQRARILAETGALKGLHEELAAARSKHPDIAADIFRLEAELLTRLGALHRAEHVYTEAIEVHPEHLQLRYGWAMFLEQTGRIEAALRELEGLALAHPQDASALNAYGYTLLLRTERHQEALALIERALALAPGEPAIMDSMGWALYKLGRYSEALSHLQAAADALPEPEVIAHLVEVLWAMGRTDSARARLQAALREHPESEYLTEVRDKLGLAFDDATD